MRRGRKSSSQAEAPGQDSFLDVVANLVGIIIILVMIVGTQAKKSFMAAESAAGPAQPTVARQDIAVAVKAATAVETAIHELQSNINRQSLEVSFRRAERNQLQEIVTLAEQEFDKLRETMSGEERARFDVDDELLRSKGELEKLGQSLTSVVKPPPTAIQHLPTPMAKTVFGREVHFRLMGGQIAYVPMDEMAEVLQKQAGDKVYKLKSAARIEESLPVINGFAARYILYRDGNTVALEEMYFVDADENLGEPFADALSPGSSFLSRIAGLDPKQTTVTFWVYPDSFDQFREVKSALFQRGLLTAARPLPEGAPIAAGPSGTRSRAE